MKKPNQRTKRSIGVILLVLGLLSFFMAQSATWVNRTIFDQKTFMSTIQSVLKTEESRQAMATTIVGASFKEYPLAEQVVGDQVTGMVVGLLDSKVAAKVTSTVTNQAYAYLTSPNQEDVVLKVTPIKNTLVSIVTIAETNGRDIAYSPESIPDAIILIPAQAIPDISQYIRSSVIGAGLLWMLTAGLLVGYVLLFRREWVRRTYAVGWSVIGVSLLGMLAGPLLPATIARFVSTISVRGLVEDVSRAFVGHFVWQLFITIIITLFVLLVVYKRGLIKKTYLRARAAVK